jgi:sugar lactone lactonase YvrE
VFTAETENMTERDPLEDVDINGRIILKRIFKKKHEIVDWTELTQDGNMWCVVNAVRKFRVS